MLSKIAVIINSKSKWCNELYDICRQGYQTKTTSNFIQDIDVIINCKPKQIICLINGCDLCFQWKRKQQVCSISY